MAYVSIDKLPTKDSAEDSDYLILDDTNTTYKMALSNIISAQKLLKTTDLSSLLKSTSVTMSNGTTLEVSVANLIKQINTLVTEVASLQGDVSANTTSIASVQSSINDLSEQINSIDSSVSGNESAITSLNSTVSSLKTSVDSLASTVSTGTDNLTSLTSRVDQLTGLVYTAQLDIANLQNAEKSDHEMLVNLSAIATHYKPVVAYSDMTNTNSTLSVLISEINFQVILTKTSTSNIQMAVSSIYDTNTVDIKKLAFYDNGIDNAAFDTLALTTTPQVIDSTIYLATRDNPQLEIWQGNIGYILRILISGANAQRVRAYYYPITPVQS